ncbi:DUF3969 family protein [Lusitaniella coriacea LEGE 07157]|uniref:DUF3969 family protein n=1 Tax=Lusitaniella coriacea LEGE 07157 TaxID=945747 RepID=A0A8J7B154_9CYAN|nr:DUF3969 family protein [Lusitaniella coriacea]MBE9115380.1 DUF3969 family protein [Lusitaniella coriacea LEGE 07157]
MYSLRQGGLPEGMLMSDSWVSSLIEFLKKIDNKEAKAVIEAIILSAIHGVKDKRISISEVEIIIFNLDILLFCKESLRDPRLSLIISYGMELDSIHELVGNPEIANACQEIEEILQSRKSISWSDL